MNNRIQYLEDQLNQLRKESLSPMSMRQGAISPMYGGGGPMLMNSMSAPMLPMSGMGMQMPQAGAMGMSGAAFRSPMGAYAQQNMMYGR
eukprot:CAMPEP_0177273498 /NCGR_PEP_ID=MMETSP0367-20130122/66644_1 /TAXON_ID=447022 ORGANISM="Scrippsiella hangoei-like, Strain SHHI-4" /NCGR_SAMPLE_ID=MMETSP0367 /ASSEMBLY_ACC=CAM_ASM_000362 /LENGTH=88 /DNA_ID=CAMNT_0018729727 /DNA_START=15 /DNA_END=281 /DNA_ORIENTATION=+